MTQTKVTPAHEAPVAPFTVDEATVGAIRQINLVAGIPIIGLGAIVLVSSLVTWFRRGTGEAIANLIIAAILSAIVIWIYNRLVLRPAAAIRYGARAKAIVASLPALGVTPSLLHTWRSPTPGGVAVDNVGRQLFVQSDGTAHERLVLQPQHIVGVKVERETELHTQTKHGGRISAFSSVGLGYTFGGRSKSKTTTVERAFLEIHYQFAADQPPGWVAIPFGEKRRDADAMAAAIQRLTPV